MTTLQNYFRELKSSSKNTKLFLLSYFLLAIQGGAYWTAYTVIIKNMFGSVALGTTLALGTFTLAIFAIPMGALTNKIGFKKMLIISTILGALAFGATAFIPNMFILVLVTVVTAPASAAWDVIPGPFVNANTSEKERTTIFSIMFAGYWCVVALISKYSGNLITSFQSSFGIEEIVAYKYFLIFTAVLSLLGAVPLFFLDNVDFKVEESKKQDKKPFKEVFKEVVNKDVLIYLIYIGSISLGAGLFTPFFSNFFKDGLHLSPVSIGNIISTQYLAMVIGMLLCPLLAKKLGRIGTLGLASLISIPFMLVIANCNLFGSAMMPILTIAFFCRSGFMNLAMPIQNTQILEMVEPEHRSTVAGIQSTFRSGLSSVTSLIAGILMAVPSFTFMGLEMDGYRIPYYVSGIIYTLGTILLFKVFYKKYNKPEKSSEKAEEAA